MQIIKLPTGTFEYDPAKPLGRRGGFGQVFAGKSASGGEVAVKKLHLSAVDAVHRELRIADELKGRSFEHVVPFIDAGEDADTGDYFVVMPIAEGSLQNRVEKGGSLAAADAAAVLVQIVKGLIEVGELVHRDLKPDNVLLHEGKWKIADFGIARFVQEATASNTLKEFLSRDYAAPEQWRSERATHATDIYALGCVGFCLLTGKPPFPSNPEEQHLKAPVPAFSCADSRLRALINIMLRKTPETRPTLSRVEQFLIEVVTKPQATNPSDPFSALAHAGATVAEQEQQRQAQLQAEQQKQATRDQLARSAYEILSENVERLWGKIHNHAPAAQRTSGRNSYSLEVLLGRGCMSISLGSPGSAMQVGLFRRSGWDVVAASTLKVVQTQPPYQWGASLWYACLKGDGDYRWYEVGYRGQQGNYVQAEPFAAGSIPEADSAASPIMSSVATAYGPWPADDEKEDEFHRRCVWLLAQASTGKLRHPSILPFDKWPPQM